VRKSTDRKSGGAEKVTVWKYFLCSRQGFLVSRSDSANQTESSSSKRRRHSNRCGCSAKITIRYAGGRGYCVKDFVEKHNHPMVLESQKHFMRSN